MKNQALAISKVETFNSENLTFNSEDLTSIDDHGFSKDYLDTVRYTENTEMGKFLRLVDFNILTDEDGNKIYRPKNVDEAIEQCREYLTSFHLKEFPSEEGVYVEILKIMKLDENYFIEVI